MKINLTYEFETAMVGKDEINGEEYYSTEEYVYEVGDKTIKDVLIDLTMDNYGFTSKQHALIFVQDFDLWENLMERYEEDLMEILQEICYNKAYKEWQEQKEC